MRIVLLVLCFLGCVIFASGAQGRVKLVEPGEVPKLDADEGLVAIVIDTNSSLREVRFRKDGKLFDAATIRNVNPGATPMLYVLPAGTYEWSRATTSFGQWYDFNDVPETKFKVEAGVLNYPGDMLMRGTYTNASTFLFTNRSLQILDWLEGVHPQVVTKYRFAYIGIYPDPFPTMYLEAKATVAKRFTELGFARKPPVPEKLPIDIRELWRIGQVDGADLNARGDLMVKVLRKSDGLHFDLVEMDGGKSTSLLVGCCPIESMSSLFLRARLARRLYMWIPSVLVWVKKANARSSMSPCPSPAFMRRHCLKIPITSCSLPAVI